MIYTYKVSDEQLIYTIPGSSDKIYINLHLESSEDVNTNEHKYILQTIKNALRIDYKAKEFLSSDYNIEQEFNQYPPTIYNECLNIDDLK